MYFTWNCRISGNPGSLFITFTKTTGTLFADITAQNRPGILYGIGVGSGNPKQMTLQALEIIRSCDLIVLPAVSKEECYAYRIVGQGLPGNFGYAAVVYAVSDDKR